MTGLSEKDREVDRKALMIVLQQQLDAISGTDISHARHSDGGVELAKKIVNLKNAADWLLHDLCGTEDVLPAREEASQEGAGEPVASTGVVHELKTWPTPFDAVASGLKPWELRQNDRGYQVGDVLRLRRWVPVAETYTGEAIERVVTWMLEGPAFGLPEGYVIMSLSPPNPQARIDALEGALTAAADQLHRIMRVAEMSSGIMLDPRRTGNWPGAQKTADAFDRIGLRAAEAKAAARAALNQGADHG